MFSNCPVCIIALAGYLVSNVRLSCSSFVSAVTRALQPSPLGDRNLIAVFAYVGVCLTSVVGLCVRGAA